MIYLKNLNGQVKEYKDHDIKTVEHLLSTGKWTRIKGLKDWTDYSSSNASKKESKKSK